MTASRVFVCVCVCAPSTQFTKIGGVDVELCGHTLPAESGADPHTDARVQLNCKVKDTGIGISPVQLATLFKSFSQ